MHWSVEPKPIPRADLPYYNQHYLYACNTPADPTMVWGTDVDAEGLEAFVR